MLYGPLGMASTSSRFDDYMARPDRAVGHIHVDGGYHPDYVRDPQPEAPAGGVSSSVNDLTHWLTMMLANGSYEGKQIVDPKALLPAVTPQIVSSPASEPAMRSGFYGFGFNVGSTSGARMQLSHSGAFELGSGTNFVILPSADVAIVALTNATPSGVPETLTAEFADLVQFGEVREDWFKLYNAAFVAMEQPVGSLVGQQPPCHTRSAGAIVGIRRHLRERLLGARPRHREGRRAGAGPRPEAGGAAETIGTATCSRSASSPRTRRRAASRRPRSTATS